MSKKISFLFFIFQLDIFFSQGNSALLLLCFRNWRTRNRGVSLWSILKKERQYLFVVEIWDRIVEKDVSPFSHYFPSYHVVEFGTRC